MLQNTMLLSKGQMECSLIVSSTGGGGGGGGGGWAVAWRSPVAVAALTVAGGCGQAGRHPRLSIAWPHAR